MPPGAALRHFFPHVSDLANHKQFSMAFSCILEPTHLFSFLLGYLFYFSRVWPSFCTSIFLCELSNRAGEADWSTLSVHVWLNLIGWWLSVLGAHLGPKINEWKGLTDHITPMWLCSCPRVPFTRKWDFNRSRSHRGVDKLFETASNNAVILKAIDSLPQTIIMDVFLPLKSPAATWRAWSSLSFVLLFLYDADLIYIGSDLMNIDMGM